VTEQLHPLLVTKYPRLSLNQTEFVVCRI